jgi:predicted nucleic acid-binding protein
VAWSILGNELRRVESCKIAHDSLSGARRVLHGALRANHDPKEVHEFLSIGVHLMDASEVFPAYAKICAAISGAPPYSAIGQNDLWIAAIALHKPLLMRNRRHFDSIPEVKLVCL